MPRKVGRPKSSTARTVSLNVRLTKEEKDQISKVAKKKGLSRTDAIMKGIHLLEME